jgi:sulfur carrier protein
MFIYVNSNRQEFPDLANIKVTLDHLNISSQRGIAIAINNNVVPRQEWETYELQPEDKMTIIRATQGG